MLLGTPNVFSIDQRTTVILTHKLKKEGASPDDIQRALVSAKTYVNSVVLYCLACFITVCYSTVLGCSITGRSKRSATVVK